MATSWRCMSIACVVCTWGKSVGLATPGIRLRSLLFFNLLAFLFFIKCAFSIPPRPPPSPPPCFWTDVTVVVAAVLYQVYILYTGTPVLLTVLYLVYNMHIRERRAFGGRKGASALFLFFFFLVLFFGMVHEWDSACYISSCATSNPSPKVHLPSSESLSARTDKTQTYSFCYTWYVTLAATGRRLRSPDFVSFSNT